MISENLQGFENLEGLLPFLYCTQSVNAIVILNLPGFKNLAGLKREMIFRKNDRKLKKNMPLFQLIGYSALTIIALYLAYEVSTSIIWLFWILTKILFYGAFLAIIVWFLYKKGFFEFLKK